MHIFRIQQVLLCFFGADSLQKELFNAFTHLNPEIPVSWTHFLPEGRAGDVSPSSFVSPSFHIRCSWESLGLQQGSEVLIPKVGVPTQFQPQIGFVCCHLSSSGSCWKSWTELSLPLSNKSGLSLRTPSLEELKCIFQVGILCLCSSVM